MPNRGDFVLINYPDRNILATFCEYENGVYYFRDKSGQFGITEKYKRENNIVFEIIEEG